MWDVTINERIGGMSNAFQSTRPVWSVTKGLTGHKVVVVISIHTPHVGRDMASHKEFRGREYFNPHAPCGA